MKVAQRISCSLLLFRGSFDLNSFSCLFHQASRKEKAATGCRLSASICVNRWLQNEYLRLCVRYRFEHSRLIAAGFGAERDVQPVPTIDRYYRKCQGRQLLLAEL